MTTQNLIGLGSATTFLFVIGWIIKFSASLKDRVSYKAFDRLRKEQSDFNIKIIERLTRIEQIVVDIKNGKK